VVTFRPPLCPSDFHRPLSKGFALRPQTTAGACPQGNVNPVERVERSALIVASTRRAGVTPDRPYSRLPFRCHATPWSLE